MSGKVYIRRFNPMEDLGELNNWLSERKHPEAAIQEIAGVGYIALLERKDEDDLPVAVAFLRRCEGGFGMLDGLATNPKAESVVRNAAIDMLVEKILERAKKYGLKHVLSWSVDTGTLERSKRHGFVASPYTLITRSF